MEFDWNEGLLADGLRLYRAGEFFAAHEAWETVWTVTEGPEKLLLQALIQITAAFHHLQRNNRLGASLLLEAAMGRLLKFPDQFCGIEVSALCDEILTRIRQFEQGQEVAPIPVRVVSGA